MSPPSEVDVIIVGGGAAGCVVAGRLAKADPNLQVAIIEAGINNLDNPAVIQPAMYLSHIAPNSTTANFYTSDASDALAGRNSVVPCGGMLGGGSSINFLMYTRASASDYDDWKMEGWAFKDILPLARKMETCHLTEGQDPKLHGTDGPLHVSYGGHRSNIGKEFVKAAEGTYDVPFTHDLQDFKTGHGITNWGKWIHPKTGRRSDTAHCYVHPVTKAQTNLHVLTEQKTIRVVFEGEKAVGVEYCANPLATAPLNPDQPPKVQKVETMKARKMVVLSSGAFGSPQILERSGVGAKDVLEKAGVKQVVDLPGVGAEYQDHQLTLATYRVAPEEETLDDYLRGVPEVHAKVGPEWQKSGQGIVASNIIDAGMKMRPTPEELKTMGPAFNKLYDSYFKNKPDKPVMFGGVVSALLGDHSAVPPGNYMMMGGYLMYPASKGHLHIKSSDPFDAPLFNAGYLEDEADMAPQVWTYKVLREIARRMPTYRGELAPLHPKFSATSDARCRDMDVESAEKLSGGKAISTGVAAAGTAVALADSAPTGEAKTTTHHKLDGGKNIEDIKYTDEDNAAIEQWLRESVQTTWHSCATNPMKARADGGVVDPRLNVWGTKNLKVADLSIIPENVGSNTYSVALTVGEKAAVLIGEDLGIKGF